VGEVGGGARGGGVDGRGIIKAAHGGGGEGPASPPWGMRGKLLRVVVGVQDFSLLRGTIRISIYEELLVFFLPLRMI
jgi:hypothetical protein